MHGVVAEAEAQQIVESQRIVVGGDDGGLQATACRDAGIVERNADSPRAGPRYCQDQIALAGFAAGRDVDADVLRWHALHLLERLLDVAQVEEVARADGKGARDAPVGAAVLKADGANDAGNQHKAQLALGEILFGDAQPGRDEAAVDQQTLCTVLYPVDPFAADALTGETRQVRLQPGEGFEALAFDAQRIDCETVRLGRQSERFFLRRSRKAQPKVGGISAGFALQCFLLRALSLRFEIGCALRRRHAGGKPEIAHAQERERSDYAAESAAFVCRTGWGEKKMNER